MNGKRIIVHGAIAVAVVLVVLASAGKTSLLGNALLTNFASATFSVTNSNSSTSTTWTYPGIDNLNVANTFSRWVCITDTPQMCMMAWKRTVSVTGVEPIPGGYAPSGDLLCFTISFSNCGNYSGFNVIITDIVPANTIVAPSSAGPPKIWVRGNYGMPGCLRGWSNDYWGPYDCSSTGAGSAEGKVGPIYLRWQLAYVGMHKSGFIRYCVTVQ